MPVTNLRTMRSNDYRRLPKDWYNRDMSVACDLCEGSGDPETLTGYADKVRCVCDTCGQVMWFETWPEHPANKKLMKRRTANG